jgi:hypothetical protein
MSFRHTSRAGFSFSGKIPHVRHYHLNRGVFIYRFPGPGVRARATLFPLDFGRIDMSGFIQTAQKKFYRLDLMTTVLR